MNVTAEEKILEKTIGEFRARYEMSLRSLASTLNEAHISHYSSGCGDKRVTFDIFPAGVYVEELLRMLSLQRNFKARSYNGFRDATRRSEYNPAADFILYLRRWSRFTEQAMRSEGASTRGAAAARAKLTMDDLIDQFCEKKSGAAIKNCSFFKMMAAIGALLENREHQEEEKLLAAKKLETEENYINALAAAQGVSPGQLMNMARAA